MKLKTKLLAGAGSVLMAGSMIAVAAPAAEAAVTTVGSCGGQVSLIKLSSPTKGVGITDQTVRSVKAAGGLAKDQTSKLVIGGTCSGVYRAGDKHVPAPAVGGGNTILSTLNAVSMATSMTGNASCANGASAVAADATAADAYPLNGKITWKFSQTYTDLLTAAPKNYTMQADVQALGFDAVAGPDVLDLGGIVLSGVNAGALLETAQTGSASQIWFDPVAKTGGATGFNTGYELDIVSAAGCADASPNNANLTQVLVGGGGASGTSLLGSVTNGLVFEFGMP